MPLVGQRREPRDIAHRDVALVGHQFRALRKIPVGLLPDDDPDNVVWRKHHDIVAVAQEVGDVELRAARTHVQTTV